MKTRNLLRNTMLNTGLATVNLFIIILMVLVSVTKSLLWPLQKMGRLLMRADRCLQQCRVENRT